MQLKTSHCDDAKCSQGIQWFEMRFTWKKNLVLIWHECILFMVEETSESEGKKKEVRFEISYLVKNFVPKYWNVTYIRLYFSLSFYMSITDWKCKFIYTTIYHQVFEVTIKVKRVRFPEINLIDSGLLQLRRQQKKNNLSTLFLI